MTEATFVDKSTGIVSYTTAGQMASIYQQSVPQILAAVKVLQDHMRQIRETFPVERSGLRTFELAISVCGTDDFSSMERELKRAAWASLISKLQLERVMSAKKRQEMHDALGQSAEAVKLRRKNADPIDSFPDVTPESILEVLSTYADSAGEFLNDSCLEIYQWLKPGARDGYKTNVKNRWKLGKKVIRSFALGDPRFMIRYRVSFDFERYFHTMDTIFHLLDGKGIPPNHRGPLVEAINATLISSDGYGETEYFKFRCCKNRSLHLEFKRPDLVNAFNLRCGCPNALPGDDSVPYSGAYEPDKTVPFAPGGDYGFFQTPRPLAESLVEMAGITRESVVLEPSAGAGRLARAADDVGATVDCVEAQANLATSLQHMGYNTTKANFLDVVPRAEYSHVLMNPPFSDGQASAHIRHAWEFLRPGGTLVAVADKGVTFRSDKRTVAFREWLSKIGATVTALPSKSFSESGTDVETVTIVATKE
jgi:hypothetical protein